MNVVWGEVNIVSIITLMSQFIVLVVFITRASDRSIRAEKAAEAAQKTANEAKIKAQEVDEMRTLIREAQKCADQCRDSITLLNGGFAAYRESVAMNYVSREVLREEGRDIEKKIDDLGRYIEKLIDARGPIGSRP